MATATISIDDALLAQVRQAAGQDDPSAWIAKACRYRLLSEGIRAAVVWERAHPAEAAAARAEDVYRSFEAEGRA